MARVTEARLTRAKTLVSESQKGAESAVTRAVTIYMNENPNADFNEIRDYTVASMKQALGVYGQAAASVGVDLFEDVCIAEGFDVAGRINEVIDWSKVEKSIDYTKFANLIKVGGAEGRERYLNKVREVTSSCVHRSCWDNVVINCEMNKMRWARVPSGYETCAWCLMLASRGFSYVALESADAGSHNGCDCMAVPGIDGVTTIDGYDYMAMRESFDAMQKELGISVLPLGKDATKEQFRERNEQLAQITELMRLKDPEWVYHGKVPEVDYTRNSRTAYGVLKTKKPLLERTPEDYAEDQVTKKGNEWRDLFVHDALSRAGYTIIARPANAPDGYKNIDLHLGIDDELWEVKSPHKNPRAEFKSSNPLSFIKNSFDGANKQFHKQYDPETNGSLEWDSSTNIVLNNLYTEVADAEAISGIKEHLAQEDKRKKRYKVLFIGKDMSVTALRI